MGAFFTISIQMNLNGKLLVFVLCALLCHSVVVVDSLHVNAAENLSAGDECVGRDQCSCQFSDGTLIDLSSVGNTNLEPAFKDVQGEDGNTYSYNPCFPFNEDDCTNVAVCEKNSVGAANEIADPSTAQFQSNEGDVVIGYTSGSGFLTTTEVILKCDLSACEPSLEAPGVQTPTSYQLIMTSVCACKDGCDDNGPKDTSKCSSNSGGGVAEGIGIGAIVIIVFFTFALLYFVGGAVFLKFGRKAQGTEIIPNYSLWKATPGLVKDGVLFTLSPCLGRRGYGKA